MFAWFCTVSLWYGQSNAQFGEYSSIYEMIVHLSRVANRNLLTQGYGKGGLGYNRPVFAGEAEFTVIL